MARWTNETIHEVISGMSGEFDRDRDTTVEQGHARLLDMDEDAYAKLIHTLETYILIRRIAGHEGQEIIPDTLGMAVMLGHKMGCVATVEQMTAAGRGPGS